MEHYLMLAAATAYVAICIAVKDGPGNIFLKFRYWTNRKLGPKNNPFTCAFCTMFWTLVFFMAIEPIFPEIKYFFGVLGIAAFIRGGTQEYS